MNVEAYSVGSVTVLKVGPSQFLIVDANGSVTFDVSAPPGAAPASDVGLSVIAAAQDYLQHLSRELGNGVVPGKNESPADNGPDIHSAPKEYTPADIKPVGFF